MISETRFNLVGATIRALRVLPSRPHFWVALALVVAVSVFYYGFVDNVDSFTGLFFFEIKHDVIGGLFFVPIAYAAVTMRLNGLLTSWGLSFAVLLPRLLRHSLGLNSLAVNTLFFVIPLLVGMAVILDIEWRGRIRRLAEEREAERQMHIEHVYRVQEEERHRIAQGLHDDVLQRLLAIAYVAENLDAEVAVSNPRIGSQAAAIREDSLRLAEDLRRLSYDLRPTILDDLGLFSAVEWLVTQMQVETGIQTSFRARGGSRRFDNSLEITAFRIVQEALSNARRHSSASHVSVTLDASADKLQVEIVDDGVGFSAKKATQQAVKQGHLGLLGMHWRASSLGGTLTIRSTPGQGARVHVSIPLASATQLDQE